MFESNKLGKFEFSKKSKLGQMIFRQKVNLKKSNLVKVWIGSERSFGYEFFSTSWTFFVARSQCGHDAFGAKPEKKSFTVLSWITLKQD